MSVDYISLNPRERQAKLLQDWLFLDPFFLIIWTVIFFLDLEEMIEFVLCVLGYKMYSKGYGTKVTTGSGGR